MSKKLTKCPIGKELDKKSLRLTHELEAIEIIDHENKSTDNYDNKTNDELQYTGEKLVGEINKLKHQVFKHNSNCAQCKEFVLSQ